MSASDDWQVPGSGVEIYDRVFVPAMMSEWAARLIALVDLQPGEHVLDVACGSGGLTYPVADTIKASGRVVGLDLSPEMLTVARARDGSRAVPIEWREGDVQTLPFENNTFDVAFCAFGLMFFPDRTAALKELRRVLKAEGRLALTVWGDIRKCPGQSALKESWERHFGTEVAAGLARMHVLSDPEMVRSLLHAADFSNVSVEPAMGVVRHLSPESLVRSYGALVGITTDDRTRSAVIAEVSTALQAYVGPGGLVYPIEAILACASK